MYFIPSIINTKGIIATQINECNSLLITEMLISGMFDELTSEEIIGLLAIFINDVRQDNRINYNDIECSDKIIECIKTINNIKNRYLKTEEDNNYNNQDYWDIAYDYVDSFYSWSCGCNFTEAISLVGNDIDNQGIIEGHFIKNMFKISKIVNDIICLCKISGNLSVIPKLQKIESFILWIGLKITIYSLEEFCHLIAY